MRPPIIRKNPAKQQVAPNLPDSDAARAAFTWDAARRELAGLPGGALNIAHEAVDRHVLAGNGARVAIRWLPRQKLIVTAAISAVAIALLTCFIDPVFAALANAAVSTLNALGANLTLPEPKPDAFPFWDATMTVLSVVAQILMTRKYVENWILWVVVNLISVGVYAAQGVYAMSLEYLILLFIAANGTRLWMIAARRAQCGALA